MKRIDGRKPDEMREVKMEVGVIKNADGSARVCFGKTRVIAAVYGPRELLPKHLQRIDRGILECHYTMAPFSTYERVRPGPSRRSMEISEVIKNAFEPVIFLEEYPKTVISIYILVEQADAGTRTAGINAASLALADAGISMRGLVTAVAAGKIDNEYVLDLSSKEEEITACDMPIAYIPRYDKVSLIQMDGDISLKDAKSVLKLAIEGCKKLHEMQKEALRNKFKKEEVFE